jgi:cytochrome c biogenesis factor
MGMFEQFDQNCTDNFLPFPQYLVVFDSGFMDGPVDFLRGLDHNDLVLSVVMARHIPLVYTDYLLIINGLAVVEVLTGCQSVLH